MKTELLVVSLVCQIIGRHVGKLIVWFKGFNCAGLISFRGVDSAIKESDAQVENKHYGGYEKAHWVRFIKRYEEP